MEGVESTGLDVRYRHFEAPPSEANLSGIESAEKANAFMSNIYRSLIQDPDALAGYSEFMKILLAQQEGAVLFHCFAGKDRTGVGAALVLTALGAEKEAVMEDFLVSNILRREANKAMLAHAREKGSSEAELEALHAAMTVDQSYLEIVYSIAEQESGSLLKYMKQRLKLTDKHIDRLREMYSKY